MNIIETYHKEIGVYKNLHKNDVCYIFGSGPSVKNFKLIVEGLFIGCNHIIKNIDIKENLKYYFFGHGYTEHTNDNDLIYGNHKKEVDNLGKNIKKFCMVSRDNDMSIHNFSIDQIKNLQSINATPCDINTNYIHKDLEKNSFLNHSIVFSATQFALYCGFTKIYLVGCDCSGYFHSNNFLENNDTSFIDNDLVYWWTQIYNFKNTHYIDTKIISINPVGLKNVMDEDIYTLD